MVSEVNSLVGSNPNDSVGVPDITPLSNGNYVVRSLSWNNNRGAVSFGDGTTGLSGQVSDANSLVGSEPNDQVGGVAVIPFNNGNYVVQSPNWNSSRGAVTLADGAKGVSGIVSNANSLVGNDPGDQVGFGVTALSNGNYVVESRFWNAHRGAVTFGNGTSGASGTISDGNSLVGSNPGDLVGLAGISVLTNGNYLVKSIFWNGNRGALTWGSSNRGVNGAVSDANSLVGTNPGDEVGSAWAPLSNGDYVAQTGTWNGNRDAVTWVNGTTGHTLDGTGIITPQNSVVSYLPFSGSARVFSNPIDQSFLADFEDDGGGRVVVGLTDPNQFNYARGQTQTVALTPDFLTATLDTGTAVILQANNDITVNDPIVAEANGHGGALTLQAGRSITLNASITTDNGPLTLIANDTLANGVVDSQRDPGDAFITMAGGTTLDSGTALLDVELRNGAGLTHSNSRSIDLQTVTAGAVNVANNGPDPGSDVRVGPVTTNGPQSYSNPKGVTTVAGDLLSGDQPVTFTDSVVINDGVSVNTGSSTVNFTGSGAQTLQSGSGSIFTNLNHAGSGTLRLTSELSVAGALLQTAGTFDANDALVTVGGAAVLTGGTYLAGTSPQTFHGGLVITAGIFTSSAGPMSVSGSVTLIGGSLSGEGMVDALTAYAGTVAPGGEGPGVLTVGGPTSFNPLTTLKVQLNGTDPGTGYSQLVTTGPTNLGGSTLNLVLGFDPPVSSTFEIVTTSDSGGIIGTFNGLPEGAVFSQGGYQFQITYHGGDLGTSVVLTRLS
jgi:hypothetical protein